MSQKDLVKKDAYALSTETDYTPKASRKRRYGCSYNIPVIGGKVMSRSYREHMELKPAGGIARAWESKVAPINSIAG